MEDQLKQRLAAMLDGKGIVYDTRLQLLYDCRTALGEQERGQLERGNRLQTLQNERDIAQKEQAVAMEDRDAAKVMQKLAEDRLQAVEKERDNFKALLRYVAYQRLPLGDVVFDHLPPEWQARVKDALV